MILTFTQSPLDFSGSERINDAFIAQQQAHPEAKAIVFHALDLIQENGKPLICPLGQIKVEDLAPPYWVYLGLIDGVPWFGGQLKALPPKTETWPFRPATMALPHDLAAISGRARALIAWHSRRTYCSNCAQPNSVLDGGLRLKCSSCVMEHYPRIDPCVIMLVHCEGRAALGRQANWPDGMYATLAGFMEPGETIEEACAREVMEETGQKVIKTEYIASQPWPFPSSLMIGLIAEIEPGHELVAQDDLEDAKWFDRESLHDHLEGRMKDLAPNSYSISRLLMKTWLDRG